MTEATPELIARAKIGDLYLEMKTHNLRLEDTRQRMVVAERELAELINERRNKSNLHNGSDPNG